MGLDIAVLEVAEEAPSFSSGYGWFHRLRVAIAAAAGLDLSTMHGFTDGATVGRPWTDVPEAARGLVPLLYHSDCDGGLRSYECAQVARALEPLLPKIEEAHREDAALLLATLKAGADRAGVLFH